MLTNNRNLASLLAGVILIGVGLLSVVGQVLDGFHVLDHIWHFTWPFFVIGFGMLFFVGMFAGGKSTGGLAIPGSIITAVGLMLFYQNLTNHWESWAYGWTVILMAVGLGIFIMGAYQDNEDRRQAGLKVLKLGLVMFVIFGAFFELLFSTFSPFGLRRFVFPLMLIAFGAYLVITRSGLLPVKSDEAVTPTEEIAQE
jgi:hypothetical protein